MRVFSKVVGVIFDLDGTLVDTLPVCFVAFRQAFRRRAGPVYPDDQIRALFGPSEESIMQRAMPERWQEAPAAYLAEYQESLSICPRPFRAIESTLAL